MSERKPVKDGGPAFPHCVWTGDIHAGHAEGLSIRDYLAAHAPPPAEWYDPPPTRPRPAAGSLKRRFGQAVETPHPKAQAAIIVWEMEQQRHRETTWPWVWADAMLATRDRGQEPSDG